jgi:hypothetical protein
MRRTTWEEQCEKNYARRTVHKLQPERSTTSSNNAKGMALQKEQHTKNNNTRKTTTCEE